MSPHHYDDGGFSGGTIERPAMQQLLAANRGSRQYRYYVCARAQKRGRAICPTRSVNAQAIERALLERLRQLPIDHKAMVASPIAEAAKLFDAAGTTEPAGDESLSTQEQARLIRSGHGEYNRGTSFAKAGIGN